MKIDIQGSDLAAMRGSINTIKKHQMPIVLNMKNNFKRNLILLFQDYVNFVDIIKYKFVKTIDSINYLIVPK